MDKKRVGILRGGQGDFYESSVAKGGKIIAHVIEHLSDKYKVIDIFIDKEGLWHSNGMPILPADLMHRVDAVWNTSHPNLNNVLENFSIPNVGIAPFSKAIGDSREMLNEHIKNAGVSMPRHLIIPVYQKDFDGIIEGYAIKKAKEVHEKFGAPWIVRALNFDIGVHVAKTFPELVDAINDVISHNESILVEELISGKNAFVHTVSGFRGKDIYSFPLSKYTEEEKERLNDLAKNLHKHIGASYYLKSNFVLNPQKGIYLTSVEFFPDLRQDSHFHQMCKSVGTELHKVVEHILDLTLNKKQQIGS